MFEGLRVALSCALLAAATGVAVQAARAVPMPVSADLQATSSAVVGQVDVLRKDLTMQVEGVRYDLLARAVGNPLDTSKHCAVRRERSRQSV
jgi:hypothetical protein